MIIILEKDKITHEVRNRLLKKGLSLILISDISENSLRAFTKLLNVAAVIFTFFCSFLLELKEKYYFI